MNEQLKTCLGCGVATGYEWCESCDAENERRYFGGLPDNEVLTALEVLGDVDRQDLLETIRMLWCMFCGRRHPKGKMCSCWDGTLPKGQSAEEK